MREIDKLRNCAMTMREFLNMESGRQLIARMNQNQLKYQITELFDERVLYVLRSVSAKAESGCQGLLEIKRDAITKDDFIKGLFFIDRKSSDQAIEKLKAMGLRITCDNYEKDEVYIDNEYICLEVTLILTPVYERNLTNDSKDSILFQSLYMLGQKSLRSKRKKFFQVLSGHK